MAKGDFINISILGGEELQRTFLELPLKLQKSIVRKANTKAMKPIERAVQRHVPKLTGALQRGIKSRAIKTKRGRRKLVGRILALPERSFLGIPESDKFYYPAVQEYKDRIGFLRKGFDEAESQAIQILDVKVTAGIKREWAKKGRSVLKTTI